MAIKSKMKIMSQRHCSIIIYIFSLIIFYSCVEKKTFPELKTPAPTEKDKLKGKNGVWHTVEPGQTLWRICKAYQVDMEKVARLNNIEDPTKISTGQKIFIPGPSQVLKVEPYQPTPGTISKPVPTPKDSPQTQSSTWTGGKLLFPVPGGVVYSYFGKREDQFHEGIDISAKEGTPIYAVEDGRVVYGDDRIRGYGYMIVIKHAGNLSTVYAHNRINLVKEGEFVRRGDKIAEVGSTGRTTGPHLHFEVRIGKEAVDPLKYLEKPGSSKK